jgi:F420-dependent oxidoreductase-like protein
MRGGHPGSGEPAIEPLEHEVEAMRFAFKTAPQETVWRDLLAIWKEADRIELFESGWLFDHFYPLTGNSTGPCLEGWTVLTALAQATTRLRLGTLVTGIHYRHPAVLAKMVATIDIISNGRLELGIGAGWNEEESGAYGIELGTPRQRSDRLEEACQVLIGLLTSETTDFHGRYYSLTSARCEPKGPQRPHPPICIGGSGERRTLRTVARYAQHWNFVGGTPEEFAHKRDVLSGYCIEIGRDPKEIVLSSHIRFSSTAPDDLEATVESVRALAAEGLDLAIVYLRPPLGPSVLGPLAEALAPLREHAC